MKRDVEKHRAWQKRSKPLGRKARMPDRKPLPKVNRKRKAKRHAAQFAEQAAIVRQMECCGCAPQRYRELHLAFAFAVARGRRANGWPERSQPHHEPSVGAGGIDKDTVPLCPDHHTLGPDAVHRIGVETFEAKFRIDIRAIAAAIQQLVSKERT